MTCYQQGKERMLTSAKEDEMKGYGKKSYMDDNCHVLCYLMAGDRKTSWPIYRTFTPFSKRRHKALTTNKAAARRANRIACSLA